VIQLRQCLKLLTKLEERGVLTTEEQHELAAIRDISVQASLKQVDSARDEHQSDECEIDDTAYISDGGDGCYWVSAWVWVSNAAPL
jgi:hypothetical protein